MTLVEFLRARLDEDEAAARSCAGPHLCGCAHVDFVMTAGRCDCGYPARALAEVDAKRKILDEHFGFLHPGGNPDRACRRCSDLRADDDPMIHAERWLKLEPSPCVTLRLLALPYAAHSDYDEAWRP